MSSKQEEKIVKRSPLFTGKYLRLETLDIKFPNGKHGTREVVKVKDAVAVLLLDERYNAHLVRQHRPAISRTILEIPAGLIDEGEKPEEAAAREAEEETGFRPKKLKKLLTYAHAEGYSNAFLTLYLGTALEKRKAIHLDETEFLEPVTLPFFKLVKRVRANNQVDSKTIIATLLCESMLE